MKSFIVIVLSTLVLASPDDDLSMHRFRGHVKKVNGRFEIVTGLINEYKEPTENLQDVSATGFWDQTYNTTGWSVLEIKTSASQSDIDQAYSAGLLEGKFTTELTELQRRNSIADICDNQTKNCEYLKQYLEVQLDWISDQISEFPDDEYWHQVMLLLVQLNGLIDGHENNQRGPRYTIEDPLGLFLFQIVESVGDIKQRIGVPNAERHDSCSALIRILPNNTDIYVSHADWSNYKTMLKVIKRYIMPMKRSTATDSAVIPGAEVVFSSYPGTLHSIDDFYMTKSPQLTVIETTIVNYNIDLYHHMSPISVPEWIRIVVANRLATSGQEWVDKFFLYNDGTYNNQWMIVDFKKFTPGQLPTAGFLTVAEQMVTDFEYADMTPWLNNNSYWASYNNVYFPRFRDISGEEKMVQTKGPELYSWQNSSRARIFSRDVHKVVDLPSMIHMMRYNDFKNDPLSSCKCIPPFSAELTIAARCDLNPMNGTYPDAPLGHRVHGATDAKITSRGLMEDFNLVAIAGPTSDGQPPFVWSQSDFDTQVSHLGHPDVWNFGPYSPAWIIT